MIALAGGELEHGGDVLVLEIRIVGKNLGAARAGGQKVKDVPHADAQSANGRPPATHSRIDADAMQLTHDVADQSVCIVGQMARGAPCPPVR